jgi:hypothetical protein
VSMPTRSISVWLHDTSHVKVSYTESHEEGQGAEQPN